MFPTTRWSAIHGALSGDGPERTRAWSALVAAYWRPAYKHLRIRWRRTPEDAEDSIQSFFARAFEKDFFDSYDPAIARFRTFFRTCLDRFVANEQKALGRFKRGGGAEVLSLDFAGAEAELVHADGASPEELFDREWRRNIFTLAVEALRAHCIEKKKESCFALFERYDLAEEPRPTYQELARDLGLPATTVTNHLAYARRELRRLVLAKLEEITATHEEFRDEARALLGVDVG